MYLEHVQNKKKWVKENVAQCYWEKNITTNLNFFLWQV